MRCWPTGTASCGSAPSPASPASTGPPGLLGRLRTAPPHNDIKAIAEDRDGLIWFGTEWGACSFDGTTWKTYRESDGLVSDYVSSIAVDADNNKWFGGFGASRFDGATWTRYTGQNSPLSGTVQSLAVGPDGTIWFGGFRQYDFERGTTFGMNGLVSFDGTTWKVHPLPVGKDTPISLLRLSFDSEGNVWVGTHIGVFLRSRGNVTTNIVAESAPSAFTLTGNYPNPFNPSTTIGFTLPEPGPATLSIYNVAGQKVRELVNAPLAAGAHSVVWNGRDMNGRPVSSGVYLTRLLQGNKTAVGRMLLAK